LQHKEVKLEIEPRLANQLSSLFEENAGLMEEGLEIKVFCRGNEITLAGESEPVDNGVEIYRILYEQLKKGYNPGTSEITYLIHLAKTGKLQRASVLADDIVAVTSRGKKIFARTIGQKIYVDSIRMNGVTFGIGPAGSGKTYLAVEAGEKLGFLPGDLQEKVDPYLRPLYDALYDIMGVELFQKYFERGIIEIAPLA